MRKIALILFVNLCLVHFLTGYLIVEHKNGVIVFLVLFAEQTGRFMGTDSLSGHRKETGKKNQEARPS